MRPFARTVVVAALLACSAEWASAAAHHVAKIDPPRRTALATDPVVARSGHVSSIVVENRVDGTEQRYGVLVTGDGTRYLLQGALASTLEPGESYAIDGRANGQQLFVDGAQQLQGTGARAKRKSITVDGFLRLGHADNFDGTPSNFFYAVTNDASSGGSRSARCSTGSRTACRRSVTGQVQDDGVRVRRPHRRARSRDRQAVRRAAHLGGDDELHRVAGQVPDQRRGARSPTRPSRSPSPRCTPRCSIRCRPRASPSSTGKCRTACSSCRGSSRTTAAADGCSPTSPAHHVRHQRDRHRGRERGDRARLQPQRLYRPRLRLHEQRAGLRMGRPRVRRLGALVHQAHLEPARDRPRARPQLRAPARGEPRLRH